jgi:hypothetical protein
MKKIILIVFLIVTTCSYAADDSKLWLSIGHRNDLTEKLQFEFESEMRFNNEMSELYQLLFNFGLRFTFNDYFKFTATYRTRTFEYDEFQNEMLLKGDFEYDITSKTELGLRLRYNKRWREYDEDKEYIRPRIKIDYDFSKRLKPFFDIEGLYRINDNNPDRFDEVRYTFGIEFDLPKKIELEVYYAYHDEMNKNNIVDSHLLGIKWLFND